MSKVFSYKGNVITASCKKEAIKKIISCNTLKELNFPKTEDQEIIFLNSLVNLKGKDSEKVFTEVDIGKLSKLLEKYPKYKDKIPTKLIRLIERNSLIA